MNNEQQQIIDDAYDNFINKAKGLNLYLAINKDVIVVEGPVYNATPRLLSKEEFINKCKTDTEFSEKWGLKIEERELSLEERIILAGYDYENRGGIGWNILKESVDLDNSIPRKVTTITYKEQTITSYE